MNFKIHPQVRNYGYMVFEKSLGIELVRQPKDTKDALDLAIEKWKLKLKILEEDPTLLSVLGCTDESIASEASSCGLCRIYLSTRLSDDICVGCPVFEKTGQSLCGNTPIDHWQFDYDTEIDRVRAEIRFLESLLGS